jgi:exopolysaccharide biosynthesis protein
MVIHIIKIDLDAPGISFVVTPPNPAGGRELRAQTTSSFLRSQHAQLAINGDFFDPWWDNSLVDYWPWAGMPVDALGFAASDGEMYSDVRANHSTVFITEDNRVTFDEHIEPVYNAISGNVLIVMNGQPANMGNYPYFIEQHPRTAIGLDQIGRTLILMVIDGRQSSYSIGASIPALADILIQYGAWTALNMDGGGSSALIMEGENGLPAQLSAPIHNHIPYRERPIANHLGVYALPLNK